MNLNLCNHSKLLRMLTAAGATLTLALAGCGDSAGGDGGSGVSADTTANTGVGTDAVATGDAVAADTGEPVDAGTADTAAPEDIAATTDGSTTTDAQDDSTTTDAQDGSTTTDAQDGSTTTDAQDDSTTTDAQDDSTTTDAQDDSTTTDAQDDSTTTDAQDGSTTTDAEDGGTTDAEDGGTTDTAACGGKLGCACTQDSECTEGKCLDGKNGKVCTKPCEKTTPDTEVCDGVDNDCNGQTDDKTCDDKNKCTEDKCGATAPAPKDEKCEYKPVDGACDDGSACTTSDACKDGKCTGAKLECDDKNSCTTDSCDLATGCTKTANSEPCDDSSACTIKDGCADGKCGGAALVCDDKNPCTDDACDPIKGCANAAKDGACDDGDACTKGDACNAGKCAATDIVVCDDKNPCTTDACEPATGCTATDNADKCDDGNACSLNDACAAGKCVGTSTKNCDDSNACTKDACDAAAGCTATSLDSGTCDDGSLCTKDDACAAGKCGGSTVVCDDANPCTADSCDVAKGCTASNDDNLACSDGDACTEKDACAAGKCAGASKVVCDDSKACTDDACDSKTGCTATNNSAGCDDGDACTAKDACKDGKCAAGSPMVCDDSNACTDETCDKVKGCQSAANKAACSDGDACTTGDICADGKCAAAAKADCDDKSACTDDSCDSANGCLNKPNVVGCDDGDACTGGDKCADGKCVAGGVLKCDDNNACTADACDKAKGCVTTNTSADCDDGDACTNGDKCSLGKCQPGPALKCDDVNPCTNDSCDTKSACVYTNNLGQCDDGDACTAKDGCDGGKCVAGAKLTCDDSIVCTTDSCDKLKGCANVANALKCSDNNECTVSDKCTDGKCVGAGTQCDDKNPCTDDKCSLLGGCSFVANVAACDDGKVCTDKDTCKDKACESGLPKVCNDGNGCTTDSCDPVKGCVGAAVADCVGLPYAQTFSCADPGLASWALSAAPLKGAAAWGVDATANPPGYWSPACSLNFNNGAHFECTGTETAVGGTARSPQLDATGIKVGAIVRVAFRLGGKWENDSWDNLDLEYSIDGTKTWLLVKTYDSPPAWNGVTVDLPAAVVGKTFHLRFKFSTSDCAFNDTTGAFIDDFAVVPATCAKSADCNDLNACSVDSCDLVTGKCSYKNQASGVACDDGNACSTTDICNAFGMCSPGPAKECNDKIVCTTDACNPQTGCTNVNNIIACTDSNACTDKDLCSAGKCVPGKDLTCDDSKFCTADSCASATGCVNTNKPSGPNAACDGTSANGYCYKAVKATANWQSAETACIAWGGNLASIASAIENNAVSKTAVGICGNVNAWIGLNDIAVEGAYKWTDGTAFGYKNWAVGQPNNVNNQDAGQMSNPAGTWDDEVTSASPGCYVCKRALPVLCDDVNKCTTVDLCDSKGACIGSTAPNCNDNNVCTNDSCDPKLGCVNAANTVACNDGNACTTLDTCAASACKGGVAPNCDDALECTIDTCDATKGCVNNAKVASGPACDGTVVNGRCFKAVKAAGTWATAEAACKTWGGNLTSINNLTEQQTAGGQASAVCGATSDFWIGLNDIATEGNYVWSDGTAVLVTYWGTNQPNNANNEDVVHTVAATSKWNDLSVATPLPCYVCEKADPPACNDGSACTTVDKCAGSGKCVGTSPPNCDDKNPCTTDSCDVLKGCVNANNVLDCSDNSACTVADKCAAGACVPGAKLVCDDKTVCTADSCDAVKGCVFTPNAAINVGAPVCDGSVVGTRCYKPFKKTLTPAAAETACVQWGGHLASIADVAENTAVRTAADRLLGNIGVHIGGNDLTVEGKFVWYDGSAFTFTNWNTNEPNNSANEDYVQLLPTGKWSDIKATDPQDGYVCERAAPPKCEDGGTCNDNYCAANGTCTKTVLHNSCAAGTALESTCSTCSAKVCAADPWCCANGWDQKCVDAVLSVCVDNTCIPSCAHSMCTVAATGPLQIGCDKVGPSPGCVSQICKADPFCCSSGWDVTCLGHVFSVCKSQGCTYGTCGHSLCSVGAKVTKGCDGAAKGNCATLICNADAFCCTTSWDQACVNDVATVCKHTCY
ncbi:MAG: hypothetical protein EXR77_13820 [Myxococcales bacterium]|nr:hypothetical protein [Myxococcales bacterium]